MTSIEVGLIDVTMPQMGVSVAEGTIVEWRRSVGDRIEADETICEISTDKIDTEVPSPVSGTVAEILVAVEETVEVGTVLARISASGSGEAVAVPVAAAPAPPTPDAASPASAAPPQPRSQSNGSPPAAAHAPRAGYSPVVRRMAEQHGVDLDLVTGTGRDGRVRKQDVLAFLEAADVAAKPLHIESPYRPDAVSAGAHPALAAVLEATGAPLSRMRRSIGEHMKRSQELAATCTTWMEVDMSRIEAARALAGLTALPYVARATVAALRAHPQLNAWFEHDRFTQHGDVNLGIAVSLGEDGLIVPVIHGAQDLSVEGIARAIRDLARRARARELGPDDVRGGTFTITNPGQYGAIMATPVINQPQVAILDLEAVVKRPVVVTGPDGQDAIAIRPLTILGMSWDHRALDGALSAQFLATVKRHLESWDGAA